MRKARLPQIQHNVFEIIPNKFIFSIGKLENLQSCYSFTIDNDEHFKYLPFFEDFGPLPLHHIHYFMVISLNYMNDPKFKSENTILNFYCGRNPQQISNAILLASSFRLIYLKMTPENSIAPYLHILQNRRMSKPYRDASSYPSTYDLSVYSCIKGLSRAMTLGWYDPKTFDCQTWADNEMMENGDMNWLIPNKLLAFASPYSTNNIQGFQVCTPADIVPKFQELGITHIIRLNNKTYDEKIFMNAGFKHIELYFADGTNPPPEILNKFLDIINGKNIIALHCKAGLGRTGTLAGCYMINKFGFSAAEAIGWIRICRPGSIIGPQQHFLMDYESYIQNLGIQMQIKSFNKQIKQRNHSHQNLHLLHKSKVKMSIQASNLQKSNSSKAISNDVESFSKCHQQHENLPSIKRPNTNKNSIIARNKTALPKLRGNENSPCSSNENLQFLGNIVPERSADKHFLPPVPQPRKIQRAINNSRRSIH